MSKMSAYYAELGNPVGEIISLGNHVVACESMCMCCEDVPATRVEIVSFLGRVTGREFMCDACACEDHECQTCREIDALDHAIYMASQGAIAAFK
jgi:hypothetical protein